MAAMRRVKAMAPALALVLGAALACCGGGEGAGPHAPSPGAPDAGGTTDASPDAAAGPFVVPSSPQRPGNAQNGYADLVNDGYVGCGIPWTAYSKVFSPAPASQQIPGRNANNATVAYNLTRFTTVDGVDVVG